MSELRADLLDYTCASGTMPLREVGMPMSDALVLAMLAGHKSQTRRLTDSYRVGDVVYLREAWRATSAYRVRMVQRRADNGTLEWPREIANEYDRVFEKHGESWRPPRFMFRALARPERWIVTKRREMKLQSISREDAISEGSWTRNFHAPPHGTIARPLFRLAWNTIHPKTPAHQWEANPTVYAYTLEPFVPRRAPATSLRERVLNEVPA